MNRRCGSGGRLALLAAAIMMAAQVCEARGLLVRGAPKHAVSQEEQTIQFAGRQRTYRLYAPASPPPGRRLPLILAIHGGGGTPESMEELSLGRFNELAERHGWLVVYPAAIKFPLAKPNWNDGRNIQDYPAQRTNVDDVGFLSALIDHLVATRNADPHRVYVTGASNGGIMSLRVGCELAEKVAAIAPVIGSLAEPLALRCAPSRPVPMFLINGTADPLVPWNGGDVHFRRKKLGRVIAVPETARRWAAQNGCDPAPQVTALPDRDPADGTRVRRETYGSCRGGAEVVLYAVEGGGHTWPGGYPYAPEVLIGKTSREFNAGDAIWEFFEAHVGP